MALARRKGCPQCGGAIRDRARYCGHCGVSIPLWDLTWALRRAVGGGAAGGAGWVVSLAFVRLAFPSADLGLPHPLFASLAGAFLGLAGGLMEHSSSLGLRGLAVGGAGGLLAASAVRLFAPPFPAGPAASFWAHVVFWAAFGLLLGLACGRLKGWESAGGLFWGALAGALSWNFSVAMSAQVADPAWPLARGIEFLAGAVVGALLWGGLALTGRFGLRAWRALSA